MERLVYCVVVISDTRQELVESVTEGICHTDGCILVHVHADKGAERMVASFVGSPETVVEGALNAAVVVQRAVDMRYHKGPLNPVGALHAAMFTPFCNCSIQQCQEICNSFGQHIADLLEVPVYPYNCAPIEDAGYDNLVDAIAVNDPLYGPKEFQPSWGTTLIGSSKNYIMMNINLLGTRDQANKISKHLNTNNPDLRAQAVVLEEGGNAVISCEILDSSTCSLHSVMDQAKSEAVSLNVATVGSHIVGSISLQPLIQSADHYISTEGVFLVKEQQKLRFVIDRLGLNSVSEFKPDSKIVEYVLGVNRHGPLQSSTLQQFVDSVGARTTAPGGGSVTALVAALGASLGQMTAWMTYGHKKFESSDSVVKSVLPVLHRNVEQLLPLIDADAMAFNNFIVAQRMPHVTEEDAKVKEAAMEEALLTAIHVPLRVMELSSTCWDSIEKLSHSYNTSLKSDLQVAVKCLEAGTWGAHKNVMININDVSDETKRQELADKARKLMDSCEVMAPRILAILDQQ